MASRLILVSGPTCSGKSRWAEHLATLSGRTVVYLATGPLLADDADWQRRLERHRRRRPEHWCCHEVGDALAPALAALAPGDLALVDSLGTWVAAGLDHSSVAWQSRCNELLNTMEATLAELVVVSEEVGWGVVPATAQGHRFRERLGSLQSSLAQRSDQCWLVMQQQAINLSQLGQPVPS
jgi:adenosylcobinamide kinase/adenosylcobinamide-phosphate guanylyltransferase